MREYLPVIGFDFLRSAVNSSKVEIKFNEFSSLCELGAMVFVVRFDLKLELCLFSCCACRYQD